MSAITREVQAAQANGSLITAAEQLAPRDASVSSPAHRPIARLPFTVRVVDNEEALARALAMRQAAYRRHVPEFAKTMDQAEPYDRDPGGLVLLAESKLGRQPVGTMRIQSNACHPLALEVSLPLPSWLTGRLVGATRLGVEAGEPGRMVKVALFKALYLYCIREGIDWMAIAARPPLDRQYAALQFADVFGEKEFIPLPHAANIPHRVMAFDVANAEQRWRESGHPLHAFMIQTHHPDIDLSAAPRLSWTNARHAIHETASHNVIESSNMADATH